jgi:hypothetical protein
LPGIWPRGREKRKLQKVDIGIAERRHWKLREGREIQRMDGKLRGDVKPSGKYKGWDGKPRGMGTKGDGKPRGGNPCRNRKPRGGTGNERWKNKGRNRQPKRKRKPTGKG